MRLVIGTAIVLATSGCFGAGTVTSPPPTLPPEYAVYWAALEPLQRNGECVFVASSAHHGYHVRVRGSYAEVTARFPLARTEYLRQELFTPLHIHLVADSLVPYLTLRHHQSVIRISQVSFSADSNRAALFRGTDCGMLCGGDNLLLVERDDTGRWRIRKRILTMQR